MNSSRIANIEIALQAWAAFKNAPESEASHFCAIVEKALRGLIGRAVLPSPALAVLAESEQLLCRERIEAAMRRMERLARQELLSPAISVIAEEILADLQDLQIAANPRKDAP